MSKTATRFPLVEGVVYANQAVAALRPHVEAIEVAGSIRRGRPFVGDVDLVVQLDVDNPWARNEPIRVLCELGYSMLKEGEQIVSFGKPSGHAPYLDLYITTPAKWGITLLVRTGSAAHNIRLAQRASRRTPMRKFTLHGIEDTGGRVVGSKTEEEVFGALGLLFIDPKDREAPELEHLVRQEIP